METGVAGYSAGMSIEGMDSCITTSSIGWSLGLGEIGGVMGPSERTISESRLERDFLGMGWKKPTGYEVPGEGIDAERGGKSSMGKRSIVSPEREEGSG